MCLGFGVGRAKDENINMESTYTYIMSALMGYTCAGVLREEICELINVLWKLAYLGGIHMRKKYLAILNLYITLFLF